MRSGIISIGSFILATTTGCLGGANALAPCGPHSQESAICGLMNPEDLGFLPGETWILVSEMAPNAQDADSEDGNALHGRLTAIRVADMERRTLYPQDAKRRAPATIADADPPAAPTNVKISVANATRWGDLNCPGEPDAAQFRPHGIGLGQAANGRPAVAVVNHGGREAVELFEVLSGDAPALVWRGCVPMPVGVSTNDVALLPSGGFVVTNFMPAFDSIGPKAIWTMLKISFGARTGSLLRWEPGTGIEEIENSRGSAPNGVVASADGTEFFVAEWGGRSIYRLRLNADGPPVRDEVALEHNPDNLTWMRDGRLLVAGQKGGVSTSLGCGSIRDAGCDIGYSVYALDPASLEANPLLEGRGAASVALEVGDEVFVGFFIGDQVERRRQSN